MMEKGFSSQDLKIFSNLGNALWVDTDYCQKSSSDTLAAASLMKLTPERTLEKATLALLEKARLEGIAGNTRRNRDVLAQPFFRLTPDERFILVALHTGRWTYERLGRILQQNEDEIQELAWSARLQVGLLGRYPAGPSTMGPFCPQYDPRKPWTQRFLDDEISAKRDFFFLQNHLVACTPCREALGRSREIYFRVEDEVLKVTEKSDFSASLSSTLKQGPFCKPLSDMTFGESLKIFSRRKNIQLVLVFLALLFLFKLLSASLRVG